jgi:broad specificity phosphatase PhoE
VTRLILVRHGETDWNVEGRWQGQSDVPLNARGQQQAEQVARVLAGYGLSAIYSSDLARASLTAEAIAQATGLPVHRESRLREIDQGEWQGMLIGDIQARYADTFRRRLSDPWMVAPPGGETALQVRQRVLSAVDEILHRHTGETVAVVSHGFSLAVIIAHYRGIPITQVWDLIPGNCEIVELEVPELSPSNSSSTQREWQDKP